jgi:hypothetical protein
MAAARSRATAADLSLRLSELLVSGAASPGIGICC